MDEIDRLIEQLADPDMDVRWQAANDLVRPYDKRTIEPLIERLADSEPAVRVKALLALRNKTARQAFDPVVKLIDDPDPEVRAAVPGTLWRVAFRDKRVPPLIVSLLYAKEPEVRAAAAEELGHCEGKHLLGQLLTCLLDPEPIVRRAAADGLGSLGRSEATEPLIKIVRDENEEWEVRCAAIEALGYIGQPRHDPPTFWELINEDSDIVNILIDLIEDATLDETVLRDQAVETLREIGDQRAVPLFIRWACSLNWDDREEAIFALGYLADLRAVPYLIAILSDKEIRLRAYAATSLGQLGDARALPELDRLVSEDDQTPTPFGTNVPTAARKAAEEIRKQMRWRDVDHLAEYIRSEDEDIRRDAIEALARLTDPRAMDLIIDAIEDTDILVSGSATKAAANAGDARALPHLARSADYWRARNVPGCLEDAETAADHIRRKLNGEEVGKFISVTDDEYYPAEEEDDSYDGEYHDNSGDDDDVSPAGSITW